ncbi:beta-ketoacyl synthase N-terminal-like domain-containing protein [Dawidia soli]|uniref:Beta-ketoacyl synthase chain length factor n=1 Tax=Dawidia soli TaxID=2782352 RepID=A0AAP2D5G8_9BACT|nr:beta-ketoacyl synthase N-terminal-like domain-containing protein [Dawidia soli]MBT1685726.1 beta-ketoacyl synthase chain length factor [Dawidia soli]
MTTPRNDPSRVYIRGMGSIAPWRTTADSAVAPAGARLTCQEPVYEDWIDPRLLRRMSRIIRLGVTTGMMALREAQVSMPDGIVMGTGYGCLEDTGSFMTKMVTFREEALNPTPFIQSTHNTIGSQLALLLGCQAYNQTFTQGAFSFEHALLDAVLHVKEDPARTFLAGGADEITDISHALWKRFGVFREDGVRSLAMFKAGHGVLHGEGAASFLLAGTPSATDRATIEGIEMLYKPSHIVLQHRVAQFLAAAGITPADVDVVLAGASGTLHDDALLLELCRTLFSDSSRGFYKHLCGEYPVATAFACWLGADILRTGQVPAGVLQVDAGRTPRYVLVFNQYFGTHYSLILLRSCHATA